jgi:hypothetical protein
MGIDNIVDSLKKTSDSKYGYGNFASKSKRDNLSYLVNEKTPGAGTYNIKESVFQTRQDFSNGISRLFRQPVADLESINSKKADNKNPAPNQYDISKSDKTKFKLNNTSAYAAFMSQSKRDIVLSHDALYNPAPGTYNIHDNFLHDSVKIPFSSFKSKTKRTYNSYSSIDPTPGPADYTPNETNCKEDRQSKP